MDAIALEQQLKKSNGKESGFSLDDFFPFQVFLVSALMCKKLETVYRDYNIENNKEWRIMAILYDKGRSKMSDIAKVSFIDPANVTRAVENLFQKEFCNRYYDPKDRRKVKVELSEKGVKIMNLLRIDLRQQEKEFKKILGKKISNQLNENFHDIFVQLSEGKDLKIN